MRVYEYVGNKKGEGKRKRKTVNGDGFMNDTFRYYYTRSPFPHVPFVLPSVLV